MKKRISSSNVVVYVSISFCSPEDFKKNSQKIRYLMNGMIRFRDNKMIVITDKK